MGLALPLFFFGLATLVAMQFLTQRASLANLTAPVPARQIAYNLRLYHQQAIAYKLVNQAAVGVLPVAAPGFLTDWRFTSCAAGKSVVTFGNGFNLALSRSINDELLRQSIVPPELGAKLGSANALGVQPTRVQRSYVNGVGIADGVSVNNGLQSFAPACAVPRGVAAIQTQVLP